MSHRKIRRKVFGTQSRPRLVVSRSLRGLYAQFIDDDGGKTICGISSLGKDLKEQLLKKNNVEKAKIFGDFVAKKAQTMGIVGVVFDRGGLKYQGRIKAFCEAARSSGLKF